MDQKNFDVIIIGGGVLGLSAAYNCAAAKKKVLLLEQFAFFNQRGSSAGYSRMWRVMYTEMDLADLAVKTSPMWTALEKDSGHFLIDRSGLIFLGVDTPYTPEGSLETVRTVMNKLGVEYTNLSSKDLLAKYPFKNLPPDYFGLLQADGGPINVQGTLRAFYELAAKNGANLHAEEPVVNISVSSDRVTVETPRDTYSAEKLIICPGAYANSVLKPFGLQIKMKVWEMTYAYYQILDRQQKYPMFFQFDYPPPTGGSNLFYLFPEVSFDRPGYVRVAVDYAAKVFDSPEQRSYVPSIEDIHMTMNFVFDRLKGVDIQPTDMTTCLVPMLEDNGFILDFAPPQVSRDRVVICTAGWAFKFAPMFGKILSELAIDGKTSYQKYIDSMSINRPGVLAPVEVAEIKFRH